RGRFQWQFGKNINDFDLSYSDPAIRESRISGTLGVHNTRLRYTIADLGQVRRQGGNLQLGFPVFRDRYTRLFTSYAIDHQLFTMGGTQYGIPLRGYDEFSITPNGFDPNASSGQASAGAFGKAYLLMTGEIGLRLSQMLYLSTFFDAGNVWARAGQFDPTRLF